jgi:4-amino-4-deoxy-L-arabinose transferase-like glycosyltransferase
LHIPRPYTFFEKTACSLFIVFLTAAAWFSFFSDATRKGFVIFGSDTYWYLFLSVYLAAAFGAVYLVNTLIGRYGIKSRAGSMAVILAAAFSVRFVWINLFDVVPKNDFSLYFNFAEQYAKSNFIGGNYISMFPHTFGYPYILSLIYRVFGSSVYAAEIFNVILGCGIAALLCFLGTRLLNPEAGLLAGLLYAVWPSQIFYAILVSTEELFTFIMLLCVCLFAAALKDGGKLAVKAAFISLLCVLMNGIRPFGILLIAVFFMVMLLYGFSRKISLKEKLKRYLSAALALAAAYAVFFNLAGLGVSSIIGKDVARSPVGFNLFVGSNIEYNGVWNAEDAGIYSELTGSGDFDAQQVHDEFARMAFERYKGQGAENIGLFKEKFKIMWSSDYDAVEYIKAGLNTALKSSESFNARKRYLTAACNLFYLAMLLFSLVFAVWSIKKSDYISLTVMLIVLGVAVIHLLAEVHGRYHYPVISLFALTAACGAEVLFRTCKSGRPRAGE